MGLATISSPDAELKPENCIPLKQLLYTKVPVPWKKKNYENSGFKIILIKKRSNPDPNPCLKCSLIRQGLNPELYL
jgi:hypothetical protein